jgi:hypothetical protein
MFHVSRLIVRFHHDIDGERQDKCTQSSTNSSNHWLVKPRNDPLVRGFDHYHQHVEEPVDLLGFLSRPRAINHSMNELDEAVLLNLRRSA